MKISTTKLTPKTAPRVSHRRTQESAPHQDRVTFSNDREAPSPLDKFLGRAMIGGAVGVVGGFFILGKTGPAGLGALVGGGLGMGAALPAAITDTIGSEKGWSPAVRVAASLGATAAVAAGLYLTA